MPEALTVPLAVDLAICVAIAVVFYAFVIWSAVTRHNERDDWRSTT